MSEDRNALASAARPSVVLVTNVLDLGGTEKAMVNDALKLRRDRWDVRVVGAWALGPRAAQLERAGIPVATADRDLSRMTELFEGADLVHVYRHGGFEPLVPAAARAAGVKVLIETNIFGHVDTSPDRDQFDCHLFVSTFCLLRYRARIGDHSTSFLDRHRTQYHTHDLAALRQFQPSQRQARRSLGLDPDRPVVGRIGRAADGKWRNLLIDAVPHLLSLLPDAQVMFVGLTGAKQARLARLGLLDRCSIQPTTTDDALLATYYAACDVFITAAVGGESGAVALIEAMAFGIPVVTCSTPWGDNGQIEFVDHGVNGYIANHPRSFAEAVAELMTNPARRLAFGDAARIKAESRFDASVLVPQLERLYGALLAGGPAPPLWSPSPAEIDAFAAEYDRRLGVEYSDPTARERVEMRLTHTREHWREAARLHLNREAMIAAWKRVSSSHGRG